jgi:hypothetical protein
LVIAFSRRRGLAAKIHAREGGFFVTQTAGEVKLLRNVAIFCFILTMGLLLLGGYFAANRVAPVPDRIL